jgi:hypothetical protein
VDLRIEDVVHRDETDRKRGRRRRAVGVRRGRVDDHQQDQEEARTAVAGAERRRRRGDRRSRDREDADRTPPRQATAAVATASAGTTASLGPGCTGAPWYRTPLHTSYWARAASAPARTTSATGGRSLLVSTDSGIDATVLRAERRRIGRPGDPADTDHPRGRREHRNRGRRRAGGPPVR